MPLTCYFSGGDGIRTREPLDCQSSALPTELRPRDAPRLITRRPFVAPAAVLGRDPAHPLTPGVAILGRGDRRAIPAIVPSPLGSLWPQ